MIKGPIGTMDAIMVALSGIAIVFIMLALLWAVVALLSRAIAGVQGKALPAQPQAAPVAAAPAPAPAPQVELIGIDELQAACVMAIVSHETGIPLSELQFRSIRLK